MASNMCPPPRSIGRALNFTTGRMNALCQQLLDPYELSLPQWVVLSCLWQDEEVTLSALADLVGNGLPAMSRIVDRMVDRGLVARRKHQKDGRAIVVILTDKGDELRHLSDFHQRINATLFEGFSPEEQDRAFSMLSRMQENAETALAEANVPLKQE
ncbi:MAG: MarR family transcriptional regulator [Paracoccaceae bacterium]